MKDKVMFICTECGNESKKWFGACPSCNEYNTLIERKVSQVEPISNVNKSLVIQKGELQKLSEITYHDNKRFSTKITEVDHVIGGGFISGSFSLIGGQPGIGKSTLVLQIVSNLAQDKKVLYVSGEESLSQIKSRADRIKIKHSKEILLLAANNLNEIINAADNEQVDVLIIDSIQTLYLDTINSLQGTPTQIKACTMELMKYAKVNEVTTLIIGHVTKDGEIAGPKQLEHMVDTVLYLEQDTNSTTRILRSFKNRFGPINEVGIFNMQASGLVPISMLDFKDENDDKPEIGCAYTLSFEGDRVFLNELQALLNDIDFGNPKRIAQKVEYNRLSIILALLENKTNMDFKSQDVFVKNISQIDGKDFSHFDLALLSAIVSSKIKREIRKDVVFLGEVALTGKIHPMKVEQNLKVLKQAGIKEIVGNINGTNQEIKITRVENIIDVLNYIFK